MIGEKLRLAFESLEKKDLITAYVTFLEINAYMLFEASHSLQTTSDFEYYNLLFDLSSLCLSKCLEIVPKIPLEKGKNILAIPLQNSYMLDHCSPKFFGKISILSSKITKILIELDYNIATTLGTTLGGGSNGLKIPLSVDDLVQFIGDCKYSISLFRRRIAINCLSESILQMPMDSYSIEATTSLLDSADRFILEAFSTDHIRDWCEYINGAVHTLVEEEKSEKHYGYLSTVCEHILQRGNYNLGLSFLEGLCRSSEYRKSLSETANKSTLANYLYRHCELIGCSDPSTFKAFANSDDIILPFSTGSNRSALNKNIGRKNHYATMQEMAHYYLNIIYRFSSTQEEILNPINPKDLILSPTPYLDDNENMKHDSDYFSYEFLSKSITPDVLK